MYYDFQIIKALDWSTAAQAFWEKEKKEIYDFSQSISPDLKKILIEFLNSKTQEEIDNCKVKLMKYYENLKNRLKSIEKEWFNQIYHAAEFESKKQDKINGEKLLYEL